MIHKLPNLNVEIQLTGKRAPIILILERYGVHTRSKNREGRLIIGGDEYSAGVINDR